MIETQVLMTVSVFLGFFLGIISWKGTSLFNWERGGGGGGLFSSWGGGGGVIFKWAWGASVLLGGLFEKKS